MPSWTPIMEWDMQWPEHLQEKCITQLRANVEMSDWAWRCERGKRKESCFFWWRDFNATSFGFSPIVRFAPIRSWSFSSTTPFRHRANKISIGESAGVTRRKRTVQARPVRLAFIWSLVKPWAFLNYFVTGASQIGCHGSAFSDHRGAYLNGMFGG